MVRRFLPLLGFLVGPCIASALEPSVSPFSSDLDTVLAEERGVPLVKDPLADLEIYRRHTVCLNPGGSRNVDLKKEFGLTSIEELSDEERGDPKRYLRVLGENYLAWRQLAASLSCRVSRWSGSPARDGKYCGKNGLNFVLSRGTYPLLGKLGLRFRVGAESHEVGDVRFIGLRDTRLVFCGSTIKLVNPIPTDKEIGSRKIVDPVTKAVRHVVSWRMIRPLEFIYSSGFIVEGLRADGGMRDYRRAHDPDLLVEPGGSIGFRTYHSEGWRLRRSYFHHWETDGVYVGGILPSHVNSASGALDRGGSLDRVHAWNNGRQGLSIIHVDGLSVSRSSFAYSGLALNGPGFSPMAGIDVEPNLLISSAKCVGPDAKSRQSCLIRAPITQNLRFFEVSAFGNLGGQMIAQREEVIRNIEIRRSVFDASQSEYFRLMKGQVEKGHTLAVWLRVQGLSIFSSVIKGGSLDPAGKAQLSHVRDARVGCSKSPRAYFRRYIGGEAREFGGVCAPASDRNYPSLRFQNNEVHGGFYALRAITDRRAEISHNLLVRSESVPLSRFMELRLGRGSRVYRNEIR